MITMEHDSDDYIELPTIEVRRWLADAARQCGYPDEWAEALAYSAWWLENRGMQGVLRATVYLLMIHSDGKTFSELLPVERDGKVICPCPILCGMLIASRTEDNPTEFAELTRGIVTIDPVLMAPIVTQRLQYKFNVHVRFHDQNVVFSKDAVSILSESLTTLWLVDAETGTETAIRLVETDRDEAMPASALIHPYRKRDTLRVTKTRYIEGGGFRFDESNAEGGRAKGMTDQEDLPDEIDISSAEGVAFVKARNDPSLWHEAAIAALAYVGDDHDFLRWLVQQPNMDRATAGWLLLWPEGSRFLRGETSGFWARIPDEKLVSLLTALCERSERDGFPEDRVGMEEGFEEQRRACLDVVANGQVASGIVIPRTIIGKPFSVMRSTSPFVCDDGLLVNRRILEEAYKGVGLG